MQFLCITKEKAVIIGVVIRARNLTPDWVPCWSANHPAAKFCGMDWEDKGISNFTWEPNIDLQFLFFFCKGGWDRENIKADIPNMISE
jgi:hypothetical protein